jgi:altronate hydrolase
MSHNRLLVLNAADTVAVALAPLVDGETIPVTGSPRLTSVLARMDIPTGHKIALCAMRQGETIVKYGQPIGVATQAIEVGEHVHTHNVASSRAG